MNHGKSIELFLVNGTAVVFAGSALNKASLEDWSVRTLDRNIGTQYYYRLLKSPAKDKERAEMKEKTAPFDRQPSELIKSPVL